MTADDFNAFLGVMKWSDVEAMRKLGIGSRNTLVGYKQSGGPDWLGLACAAAAAHLPPWQRELVYSFRVWDQGMGDFLIGKTKRTIESIARIRGAEVVPGTAERVAPDEIDPDGRYIAPPDADLFYLNRLLRVAEADEMPQDEVRSFVSNVSHLHVLEGKGQRADLVALFSKRAPQTPTAKRILASLQYYHGGDPRSLDALFQDRESHRDNERI